MGLIREPLDVDFEVDPKPLTQKEKEAISQYIREYKAKKTKKHSKKTSPGRKKFKQQA
jgi:hypothetical protein